MKLNNLLEKEGDTLNLTYPLSNVILYRAQSIQQENILNPDSYCTRSLKFAKEHAIHMANTEEIQHQVIEVRVKTKDVVHASNPGEYLYKGQPAKGKVIFVANVGDDFE